MQTKIQSELEDAHSFEPEVAPANATEVSDHDVSGPEAAAECPPVGEAFPPLENGDGGHQLPAADATVTSELLMTPGNAPDAAQTPALARRVVILEGKAKIADLKVHPQNAALYGESESIEDLLKDGRILEEIEIATDGTIISGHRRVRAARKLGMLEIRARVFDSTDEFVILDRLLTYNKYRQKSKQQLIQEATLQMRVVKELQKRRKASVNGEEVEILPPEGSRKTRDIVGERVGMSGRNVDDSVKVIEGIERLRSEGREVEAKEVEQASKKGVASALRVARSKGVVPAKQPKKAGTGASAAAKGKIAANPASAPAPPSSPAAPQGIAKLDSDGAVELQDRVMEFLRASGPNRLTPEQKKTWKKILQELQGIIATLV